MVSPGAVAASHHLALADGIIGGADRHCSFRHFAGCAGALYSGSSRDGPAAAEYIANCGEAVDSSGLRHSYFASYFRHS